MFISISSVQLLSHVWLFVIPWTARHQASLSITNSQSLLKLMSIESVMPSNHLILCCPRRGHLQSFPASGSFLESQFFASGGQSIGVWASVLPMNIQDSFPLGWTSWISLLSKGFSRVFSNTTVQNHQFLVLSFLSGPMISHPDLTTRKFIALTRRTFVCKVMFLLFNMLSGLIITSFPRSKGLLILWLQSLSAVILESKKNKVSHCFYCFPIYLPWSDGTRCHGLNILNDEF